MRCSNGRVRTSWYCRWLYSLVCLGLLWGCSSNPEGVALPPIEPGPREAPPPSAPSDRDSKSLAAEPVVPTTLRGSQSTEKDSTVYVTRTGSKFHRSNCRYLKYSKTPVTLSEARRRYTPCSVCVPTAYESRSTERPAVRAPPPGEDQTAEQTVYVTRTGKKYHRGGCRYLRSSRIPMKLSAARIRYGPCSVCRPAR